MVFFLGFAAGLVRAIRRMPEWMRRTRWRPGSCWRRCWRGARARHHPHPRPPPSGSPQI